MPTYKEIMERVKAANKAKLPAVLMSDEDIATVRAYIEAHPTDAKIALLNDMTRTGDFSRFEKLPQGLINYYSSVLMRNHLREKPEGAFSPEDPAERQLVEENRTNPFFRVGLELVSNSVDIPKETRDNGARMDAFASEIILQNTLSPASAEQITNLLATADKHGTTLTADTVRESLRMDRLTQVTLAKTLFLAQLGDFQVTQAKSESRPYTGTVSEVLAHGGRTLFTLGKGRTAAANSIEKSVFQDQSIGERNNTSVKNRVFATHSMDVKSGGGDPANYKEDTPLITDVRHNYMMNPAVGGLGSKINNGKTVLNGGDNGHVYLKMVESTEKAGGYLILGVEAEEGGHTGALGHHHNISAKPAKLSAFTAPKGGPGAKTGGRIVDLSAWDPDTLGSMVNTFGEAYSALSQRVYNFNVDTMGERREEPQEVREAREKLARINEKLAGKVMAPQEMLSFMKDELGITQVACPGVNGGTSPVSVDALLSQKQVHHGFVKFNNKASHKIAATPSAEGEVDRLMAEEKFSPNRSFENFAKGLDHNKKKILWVFNSFFGIKRHDSGEMSAVKEALRKVIDVSRGGGNANAYESREALAGLISAADAYLNHPRKNHSTVRYETVQRIREMADAEHAAAKKTELAVRIKNDLPLKHFEVDDRTAGVVLGVSKEEFLAKARESGLNPVQVENAGKLFDNAQAAGTELYRQIHEKPIIGDYEGSKDILAYNVVKSELYKAENEPMRADLADLLGQKDGAEHFTRAVGFTSGVHLLGRTQHHFTVYTQALYSEKGLREMTEAAGKELAPLIHMVSNEAQNERQRAVDAPQAEQNAAQKASEPPVVGGNEPRLP